MITLTEREHAVLVGYANGMNRDAIGRTQSLTVDQVRGTRAVLLNKLDAHDMAEAVAVAFRLCLIDCDEIDGPPVKGFHMSMDEIHEALLSYRQTTRHLPPPHESWPELRARAHAIAEEVRANRKKRGGH